MGDQVNIEAAAPIVIAPDQSPATAAVHPPTDSFGPGSAGSGGSGDGDRNVGTPDFGGSENLAQRG